VGRLCSGVPAGLKIGRGKYYINLASNAVLQPQPA
jgi:hypothetical protein